MNDYQLIRQRTTNTEIHSREGIKMTDNKNMKVNDEMMANATGGTGSERYAQFKVGDKVRQKSDKWNTLCGVGIITEVRDYEYSYATYRIKWEKYEFPDDYYWLERNLIKA